ncbi:MAG: hypothetical protein K1000chlam4_00678 [Chlamydiae bacterium]|nr:hypothetical protein [Chlamydiota bacterium]
MKHSLVQALDERLRALSNPQIAESQSAYMRNQFAFLGIQKPKREKVQKELFKTHSLGQKEELALIIDHLWSQKQREFHYSALDLITKYSKLWSPSILSLFERLIRTHSWWDTVDLIASKHVGGLIEKYPNLAPVMDGWIEDDNLWIRRTAILHQLKWKEKTDDKRLFNYCKKRAHEEEFFIRKAIGWALREYSKTAPDAVGLFIDQNQKILSPLSIREGSKYL